MRKTPCENTVGINDVEVIVIDSQSDDDSVICISSDSEEEYIEIIEEVRVKRENIGDSNDLSNSHWPILHQAPKIIKSPTFIPWLKRELSMSPNEPDIHDCKKQRCCLDEKCKERIQINGLLDCAVPTVGTIPTPTIISSDKLSFVDVKVNGNPPAKTTENSESDLRVDIKSEPAFDDSPDNEPFFATTISANNLQFPAQHTKQIVRPSQINDFGRDIELTIETNIEQNMSLQCVIREVTAFTTSTTRPPVQIIRTIFYWLIGAKEIKHATCLIKCLKHIHDLHGFPQNLPLWEFIEKAYYIDSIAPLPLHNFIKSAALEFVCRILEFDLLSHDLNHETFTLHTSRAYGLLSHSHCYGNVKTIIAWLEDSIMSYDETIEDGDKKSQLYSIITSFQKLLSFSILTSETPTICVNVLSRDILSALNRLNSRSQQDLLMDTVQSDLLKLFICEGLLDKRVNCDPFDYSPDAIHLAECSWQKITQYYFKIYSIGDPHSWKSESNAIIEYIHLLTTLITSFIKVCKAELKYPLHRRTVSTKSCDIPYEEIENHIDHLQNRFHEIDKHYFDDMKFLLLTDSVFTS